MPSAVRIAHMKSLPGMISSACSATYVKVESMPGSTGDPCAAPLSAHLRKLVRLCTIVPQRDLRMLHSCSRPLQDDWCARKATPLGCSGRKRTKGDREGGHCLLKTLQVLQPTCVCAATSSWGDCEWRTCAWVSETPLRDSPSCNRYAVILSHNRSTDRNSSLLQQNPKNPSGGTMVA